MGHTLGGRWDSRVIVIDTVVAGIPKPTAVVSTIVVVLVWLWVMMRGHELWIGHEIRTQWEILLVLFRVVSLVPLPVLLSLLIVLDSWSWQ